MDCDKNFMQQVTNSCKLPACSYLCDLCVMEKTLFKRILVPLDGSDLAEVSLIRAKALAKQYQATLVIFRVYEPEQTLANPTSALDTYHLVVSAEAGQKRAINYLYSVKNKLLKEGLTVDTQVITSNEKVGFVISHFAEENNIDLIVMTAHGYSGFRRLVLGSVTADTLNHTSCPVLVIPYA